MGAVPGSDVRIGIISDIHGDYDALQTVLDRFDRVHEVDQVLCAGDLVGRGPEQNRVVEVIRRRKIPTVRGNHDEWLNNLTSENVAYLRNLPLDWRGTLAGCNIFMCHGKPGNNVWGMYRDHLSDTYLQMVLKALKVDILVTGHTHHPLYIRVDEGCLVNPGSLYTFHAQRETSHSYGVLHLPDLIFEVFDVKSPSIMPIEIQYDR